MIYGETMSRSSWMIYKNLITRYLLISGFSVGISDLIADEKTK